MQQASLLVSMALLVLGGGLANLGSVEVDNKVMDPPIQTSVHLFKMSVLGNYFGCHLPKIANSNYIRYLCTISPLTICAPLFFC